MKIRTQITLPIMLTAIVVLSAASIYSYNFTNNILETEAVKKLEATAQLTKRYISSVLEEQKEKVEIAATHDELSIEELQEILDINPEFYEVFVVDSEGMIISSTNQSHVGSDRSKDTYFTNARNKTYIKPVYYSEFVQKDAITVSTPHADGVLVARIELEFFNSIVADKTGLGQTGESLLAYQNKEEEFVFFTEKRFEEGPHGHEATHVVLPIEEALSGNEDVFFEFDYRHIPVIAVTRYLEEANIGLVVKIDQAEAFAPSRQVLNLSIVRILLVLFIFFVIIYFLAKTISKPIEALHRGTEVIKQGNLDHKVGTNVQDEVGQLSRSFDDMVASLKKSRADIDKKVKQQTKDIVSKSKELENQQAAVLNILEDVEEEKEKTVILAKDLEKFKLAVDNASDHIVITDQDGICLYANQAVETITGYTAKEIMGQKAGIKKLWSGNMAEDFYEKLWKTITEDKKSFIGDIANTRKNGEDYDAVTSISPILDDDGEVKFIVAVERDVTKERQIDRAKSEFVSLASHQLRTPLSTVNWYAEMLLSEDAGKLNKGQQEFVSEIYKGNQRMVDLVNALLNVSRIELGTLAVDPKPTDLIVQAESVLNEIKPLIAKKKLKVIKKFDKAIPKITLDDKLMRIVWQNLLSNSLKYTPEKGKIGISITKDKTNVKIEVSDTGMGIPKAQQKNIFTKLFRADNVRERETDGTGLGLYIVKSVIQQFGGKVWFKSVENKGTTFYVTIPLKGIKAKEGSKGLEYTK